MGLLSGSAGSPQLLCCVAISEGTQMYALTVDAGGWGYGSVGFWVLSSTNSVDQIQQLGQKLVKNVFNPPRHEIQIQNLDDVRILDLKKFSKTDKDQPIPIQQKFRRYSTYW